LFKALLLHNNSIGGDIGSSTETSLDFIHTDANTTTTAYPRARISVKQGTVAADGFTSEAGGDLLFSTAFGTAQDTGILYERMRINDAGNVGIGTSAPTHVLDVRSLTTGNLLNLRSDGTGGDAAGFAITAEPNIIRLSTTTNLDALAFNTGSTQTERMRIDSAGNVGIGTTSPVTILDVNSSTADSVAFFRSSDNRARIGVEDNDTAVYVIAENSYASFGLSNVLSSTNLNINGSGNVGIGTTSPGAKLTILGGSLGALPNNSLGISTGLATGRIVGNYGVSLACIYNEFNDDTIEISAGQSSGYVSGIVIAPRSATGDVIDALTFYTRSTERMRITNAGNVGVGVTSPANKLIAASNASATSENSYAIAAAAASDPAYKTVIGYDFTNDVGLIAAVRTGIGWRNISMPQGNLGIGTITPTQKLQVTGNVRVTGAYYDSNNEAGTSGQVLTSTGTGTDWKSLSEITGVDGTGTANYVAKWSDTDTITNSQIRDDGTTVGIGQAPDVARLSIAPTANYRVIKMADDTISHYKLTGSVSHTVTLTCLSYYQAEVVITAQQTNSGGYNNIYIRGIWSNNFDSHHWDVLEEVGYLTGSSFTITNGQNDVSNSGKLEIAHNYTSGSFSWLIVRVTDFNGTHSYTLA
jgi:hypothetical protein